MKRLELDLTVPDDVLDAVRDPVEPGTLPTLHDLLVVLADSSTEIEVEVIAVVELDD